MAPVIRGVSLAEFAAVQAGLAEGIDLDAVLAAEAIDAAAWSEAEEGWADRLLDNLEQEGPLQNRFDAHLAEAQDRYARPVPPLDEQLGSWLDFVRGWSADPEPVALLARLGLHSSDIIRLQRAWSRRLANEPALAQEALHILERDVGELPIPRPAVRPPLNAAKPAAPPRELASAEPLVFTNLSALLAAEGNPGHAAVPAIPDPLTGKPTEPPAEAAPPLTAALARSHPQPIEALHPAPLKPPGALGTEETQPPAPSPLRTLPHGISASLPFVDPAASPAPDLPASALPAMALPRVTRPPAMLSGTSMGFVAPKGPALPFIQGAAALPLGPPGVVPTTPAPHATAAPFEEPIPVQTAAGAALPGPAPSVKRAPAALSGTSMGFLAPKGPALPFASQAAASPSGPPGAAQPPLPAAPAPTRAPAALSGTSMGFVAPKGPALPFGSQASASSPGPSGASRAPMPVDRVTTMPDETLPAAPSPLARPALPFSPSAPPTRIPPDPVPPVHAGDQEPHVLLSSGLTTAPLPALTPKGEAQSFPPASSAALVAPVTPAASPTLTLQQYASLCAELTVFPDRTEATFVRYGLGNLRARLTVDLSWRERLRNNPNEHQGWQMLYGRWLEHFEQEKAGGER